MKLPSRVGTVHAAMLLFAAALVIQAARVQLWQGAAWAARAERQHFTAAELPAPRGDILDAAGEKLAQSRELVRLYVAPRELRDRRALVRALSGVGVREPVLTKAVDRRRAWVPIPGRFLQNDVARITAMRGIYTEPVIERIYAPSEGARRLVGRATPDGRAVDGLELALDTLLRGTPGKATMLRDARGRRFESPTAPGVAPTNRGDRERVEQPGDQRHLGLGESHDEQDAEIQQHESWEGWRPERDREDRGDQDHRDEGRGDEMPQSDRVGPLGGKGHLPVSVAMELAK